MNATPTTGTATARAAATTRATASAAAPIARPRKALRIALAAILALGLSPFANLQPAQPAYAAPAAADANATALAPASPLAPQDEAVAQIYDGETAGQTYATLAAAVEAAAEGNTVALLSDVTEPGVTISKSIVLNLGGHAYTLSGSTPIKATAGESTIRNGSITGAFDDIITVSGAGAQVTLAGGNLSVTSSGSALRATEGGSIVVVDGATITSTSAGTAAAAVYANSSLTVQSGTLRSDHCTAISITGANARVVITDDGAVQSGATSPAYGAVYLNGANATVEVSGNGTVQNDKGYALYAGNGTADITGGSLESGAWFTVGAFASTGQVNISGYASILNSAAPAADADAATKVSYAAYATGGGEVNVSGGYFMTSRSQNVETRAGLHAESAGAVSASGGWYDTKVDASCCAEGCTPTDALSESAMPYTVLYGEPGKVARVNGATYATLNEAISAAVAAGGYQTVQLIADVTTTDEHEAIVVPAEAYITFDLYSHTLTTTFGAHTITNRGTLYIEDTIGGGKVDNRSYEQAALFNAQGGTVELSSGELARTVDAGTQESGNSYFTVLNQGTMTLQGGTVTTSGDDSPVIENGWKADPPAAGEGEGEGAPAQATLTIHSGVTITGGMYNVANGLRGNLAIEGGEFTHTSTAKGGNLLNRGSALVSGGTFVSSLSNVISGVSADEEAAPTVTLKGGTYTCGAASGVWNMSAVPGADEEAIGTVQVMMSEDDTSPRFSKQQTVDDFPEGKLSFGAGEALVPESDAQDAMYVLGHTLQAYDASINLTYTGSAQSLTGSSFALVQKGYDIGQRLDPSYYTLQSIVKSTTADDNGNADDPVQGNAPKNAGTYTATFVGNSGTSFGDAFADTTLTCDFTIGQASMSAVTVQLSGTEFNYDGSEHRPTIESVKLNGVTVDPSDYTVETPAASTSAGEYDITFTSTGKNFAADSAKTVTYTIEGAEIADGDVTVDTSDRTYNGTAFEPEVTVVHGGTELTKDTDYTVTYADNTNAGTATVTVSGMGGYAGEVVRTFTISKAQSSITVSKSALTLPLNAATDNSVYVSRVNVVNLQASSSNPAVCTASVLANGGQLVVRPVGEGSATITITGDAANGNYTAPESQTVSVLITSDARILTVTARSTGGVTVPLTASNVKVARSSDSSVVAAALVTDYGVQYALEKNVEYTVDLQAINPLGYFTDVNATPTPQVSTATISAGETAFTQTFAVTPYSYDIQYTLDDGVATPANPSGYTVETETFTLNNPVKSGFAFAGWTGTDLSEPTMEVSIPKGSTGNRSYTATYKSDLGQGSIAAVAAQEWTGSAVEPALEVTWNSRTLTAGTDYTVEYANNTEPGTATATLTGTGEFAGTLSTTFTITKRSIASAEIAPVSTTYTGVAQTGGVAVVLPGSASGTGEDVDVTDECDITFWNSYSGGAWSGQVTSPINHGTYYIRAVAKGTSSHYAGTAACGTLTINQAPITAGMVSTSSSLAYTGGKLMPDVEVRFLGNVLAPTGNYTVTYGDGTHDNISVASGGAVVVTALPGSNFTGSVTKEFAITPQSLSGAEVALSADSFEFDGTAKRPAVTSVTLSGLAMPPSGYAVSYDTDCTSAGTHYVTVTGTGNYIGSASASYNIGAASPTLVVKKDGAIVPTATLNVISDKGGASFDVEYNGTGAVSAASGDTAVVRATYANGVLTVTPVSAGTASVVVSAAAAGNFGPGSTTLTVTVENEKVARPSFAAPTLVFTGAEQTGVGSQTGVPASEAYTVSGTTSATKAGSYTATVKLNAGYEWNPAPEGQELADLTLEWSIGAASLDDVTFADIASPTYTGSPLKPALDLRLGSYRLVEGTDYTADYSDNVNVGDSPLVTVTGIGEGNFTGVVTKAFTISPSSSWNITPYVMTGDERANAARTTESGVVVLTLPYDGYEHNVALDTGVADAAVAFGEGGAYLTDAGELTVEYTATDPAGNYADASGKVKMVIEPITALSAAVPSGTVGFGGDTVFAALSSGGQVVELVVDEMTASDGADVAARVAELKGKYLTGADGLDQDAFWVYDVELVRHAAGAPVGEGTELHDGFGTASVTLPLGAKYAGRTAHVVELHDVRNSAGEATGTEEIPLGDSLTVSASGAVTVTIDKLSEFVVTLDEAAEPDPTPDPTPTPGPGGDDNGNGNGGGNGGSGNGSGSDGGTGAGGTKADTVRSASGGVPSTGDILAFAVPAIVIVAVACVVVILFLTRRRNRDQERQ